MNGPFNYFIKREKPGLLTGWCFTMACGKHQVDSQPLALPPGLAGGTACLDLDGEPCTHSGELKSATDRL